MRDQETQGAMKSLNNNAAVKADEEFVGPEYEEDAYYSGLTATPSFDDLEASDSEEILVHWHQDSGEIEEIEEADFKEDRPDHVRSTRKELRLIRTMIRDKSMRLLAMVKGVLRSFIYYCTRRKKKVSVNFLNFLHTVNFSC